MGSNWPRRMFWLAIALVIAAALTYGFWPRPQPVELATVVRAPMQVTVQEEGTTRVMDRYVVSAPVAGFARRIALKVGDAVKAAQTLVLLEPPRSGVLDPRTQAEAQARVAGARAALSAAEQQAQAARTEAEYARREYERVRALTERQLAARDLEDQARTRLHTASAAERSAQFAAQVARHDLEAARTALRYADPSRGTPGEPIALTAPIAGNVLRIDRESEGLVQAGQALLELGDPSALEVVVDVLSTDAVRIRAGMRVGFERWGGGEDLEGRVRRVEPVGFTKVSALGVEEQRVNVIIDFTSPMQHWASLGDGYRVDARFILWEADSVLQIPASALFHLGAGWAVFVEEGGRARRRAVQIGQRSGLLAQVLEGLTEGERVVTHPDETIREGVGVAPVAP